MSFLLSSIGQVQVQESDMQEQGGKELMVDSWEASYHSHYVGPLRRVLCLVQCSVVIIL